MTKAQQRIWFSISLLVVLVLLYFLRSILAPFLIAAFLAYLGDPLVNLLRRLHLSRTWAATIVFLVIMLILLGLLLFLIPLLWRQVTVLINRLPEVFAWIQQFVLPWINQEFNLNLSFDLNDLKRILAEHWKQAGSVAAEVWKVFSHSGVVIAAWLAKLLIIPVVTFYLLRDWELVLQGIQDLIPRRAEKKVTELARECNEVLGAFLRGQLLVMLALAIIYSLGLAISGLDLALLLGFIAGLLAIVPYLGVIIGVSTASIAALMQFHDWIHVLYVVIVFIVGHILEHTVLTPWFVGDRIGLHPVAVIFAILAGGDLFGVTGVLLALPVAAVLMVLVRHLRNHYFKSVLYS